MSAAKENMGHESQRRESRPLRAVPADASGGERRREAIAVARVALTYFLGDVNSDGSGALQTLLSALHFVGKAQVNAGGNVRTPLAPDLPAGARTVKSVRKELGLGDRGEQRLFRTLKRRDGEFACFEDEMLHAFIPAPFVELVAELVLEGPVLTGKRAAEALYLAAETPKYKYSNRKADNYRSKGTLINCRRVLLKVTQILCELASVGHSAGCLAFWSSPPSIPLPPDGDILGSGFVVHGPPWREVRRVWSELCAEIQKRLRANGLQGELDAIQGLSPSQVERARVLDLIRRRAILLMLLITAGRPGAILRLDRSDLIFGRAGFAPDSWSTPLINLEPRKGLPEGHKRPKYIPEEAALVLQVMMEATDRFRQAFDPEFSVGDDEPLLLSRLTSDGRTLSRRMSYGSLAGWVAGVSHGDRSQPPLVQRQHGVDHLPEAERVFRGYTPTEYRHLAEKLAKTAGEMWMAEHPPDADETHLARHYAEALTDHTDRSLDAIYGDRRTESAYEILSARAIHGIWLMLTTDVGARRRPDAQRLQALVAQRDAHEQTMEHAAALSRDLVGREIVRSTPDFPQLDELPPEAASAAAKLDALLARVGTLSDQNQLLFEQNRELRQMLAEIQVLNHEMHAAAFGHGQVLIELNKYRWDESLWELVPDDAPRGAEVLGPDFDAELFGPRLSPAPVDLTPVRDWLTIRELCQILDIGRSTMLRWLNLVARPRATQPWLRPEPPLDQVDGDDQYRRLWVPGLSPELFRGATQKQLLAEMLARWPGEKGWSKNGEPSRRSLAPLKLPPGYARDE